MSDLKGQHSILRFVVKGGFLDGASLILSDGLNCLIGGRGTGKTTALEFIRFGLGLLPDAKVHPQRRKALESLVAANLGSGRITVEVRTRTGMEYSAERGATEHVVVRSEAGAVVPISLDRDEIFSADVFSQNEIEEIASNPPAQLELLDRFNESTNKRLVRDLADLTRELTQSSAEMMRADKEIEVFRAQASEAPALEERLKGLTSAVGPDAARIGAAHDAKLLRAREERVPEALLAAIQRAVRESAVLGHSFRATVEAQLDAVLEQGANAEIISSLRSESLEFDGVLRSAHAAIAEGAERAQASIYTQRTYLATRHAEQEAEYSNIVAESKELGERAEQRQTIQTALAAAKAAATELDAREKHRRELSTHRDALLSRLSELRDERFHQRREVAARLSREIPRLRVTVRQGEDSELYRSFLAESLKGLGLRQGIAADRITPALLPDELADLAMKNASEELSERTGLDTERARRITDALRSSGDMYALQSIDLGDTPCIELRDGDVYKESGSLSTGQRCTAILPILLVQSDRPLLIDQPEDNLDNAFVFDSVVTALRTVKHTRQVIFVTHNPNIPVLGEAERVFVFSSDGHHAIVDQSGTVDECKGAIERILEGGPEAFVKRMKRYGY